MALIVKKKRSCDDCGGEMQVARQQVFTYVNDNNEKTGTVDLNTVAYTVTDDEGIPSDICIRCLIKVIRKDHEDIIFNMEEDI